MTTKQTIAVYIPKWLYRNDVGITIFVRGLYDSIKKSGTHRLLKMTPEMCNFESLEDAQAFVDKHNIAFVIYHDTRSIPADKPHEIGLNYLEELVPFLNGAQSHLADDKFNTKQVLTESGVPVLPSVTVKNRDELCQGMTEGELYVVKPSNEHSGVGVKLVKRTGVDLLEFLNGKWEKVRVFDTSKGLAIRGLFTWASYISIAVFFSSITSYFLNFYQKLSCILFAISAVFLVKFFDRKINQNFIYSELMLEPFFGDGLDEFYCLRCTVLGDEVVEAAKKANKKNVTPNISHGGKATKIELTKEQSDMAVRATKAFGATFSGVDLLFAKGQTVVCEVNVGPIGVYCEQTGVDVGGKLAEYAMRRSTLK